MKLMSSQFKQTNKKAHQKKKKNQQITGMWDSYLKDITTEVSSYGLTRSLEHT